MGSRKKLITIILPSFIVVMAMLMVACGGTSTTTPNVTKAAADKQVFVYANAGIPDIATFDPGLSTDLPSVTAINMVFTGLVGLDDNGNVIGQLASSWDVSSDHLTYTFHMRSGLKFSDGSSLTASDVAYSIDRALQPATKSGTGPYYLRYVKDASNLAAGKIKTIIGDSLKVIDPNTISITAASPVSFFLDSLTYPCSFVVEKSLVDKYGNANFTDHLEEGGGDGPYKVQSYTHSKQIVFVPNPDYYGPIPQMKVIMPFYKEADTTYNAYLSNQLDYGTIPTSDYLTAKSRTDFHQIPQLWINYYAMNYLTKPFDNIDIRQAFDLAINKDEVVKAAYKGQYIPSNHIVPQGQPGYDASLTGPQGAGTTGNQSLAKQLFQTGLQQEGWSSVSQMPPITLTYASVGNQAYKNELSIVQQQWQTVLGVSVKINDIDFNKLLGDITGTTNATSLQFWGIAWIADYPDPQDWLTLQFDNGAGNNNMNYGQNKSTDATQQQATQKIMEQADLNLNPTQRMQQYNQAEQQLVNDVAWMPMEQVNATYLLKPCIHGFLLTHGGLTPPNDWGSMYVTTATPCASATA